MIQIKAYQTKTIKIIQSEQVKQDIFSNIGKNNKLTLFISKKLDIPKKVLMQFFNKKYFFLASEKVIISDSPCENKKTREICLGYIALVFGRLSGPRWTGKGFISYFTPVWKKYILEEYCVDTEIILSHEPKTNYLGLFTISWVSDPLEDIGKEHKINEPIVQEILRKFIYYYAGKLKWITCEQWNLATNILNRDNKVERL